MLFGVRFYLGLALALVLFFGVFSGMCLAGGAA